MSHKPILELLNEVYDPLVGTAQRIGATPEALAVEWLVAASVHAIADPLESSSAPFRVTFSTGWNDTINISARR